jgi:hypothetical protein
MGEAKRRKEMEASEQPRVVATCPVCKKEFLADGKAKLLITSYMVPQGQSREGIRMAISMPKIACTGCGVEFFTDDALIELRKREAGERTNIILPKTRVKLN